MQRSLARDSLMASDDQPEPGESITLDTLQRDVLVPQIQAFLDATTDPQAREVYLALRNAIESLEIPPDLAPRLGARRNRRSSTNQRPSKTPIRPRRRAISKHPIPENPARPRSSPIPIRTKQSPGKFEGPDSRANNLLTKKPRRLLPNPKNQQLPTSNPLRTIRRKS